jgi:hypothetical protein
MGPLRHAQRLQPDQYNLSATNPAKLKEMQDLFLEEAVTNHVLPIDDRTIERLNPATAGRPDLMAGRTSLTVHQGMVGMPENVFHQCQEPVADDHRRCDDPRWRGRGHDHRVGWTIRRIEPLYDGAFI